MSLSLYSPFVSTGYSHWNHPNHIPPPTTTSALPPSLRQRRRELRSVLIRSLDQMEVSGVDSEGKEFNSAQEMWREAIGEEGDETKKTQWYRDGVSYWEVSIQIFSDSSLKKSWIYFVLISSQIWYNFYSKQTYNPNLFKLDSKAADFSVVFVFWIKGCWGFCWWSIRRIWACEWRWYYRKWGFSKDSYAREISQWRNKSASSGSWYSPPLIGVSCLFIYMCVSLKINTNHLQIVVLALEGSLRIFWYGTSTRWMFYKLGCVLLCF